MSRFRFAASLACLLGAFSSTLPAQSSPAEQVTVDPSAPGTPFPHVWEQMFGSGRAVLALREDYRRDLRAVHEATGFRYIRFHGIFDDAMGVYDEDAQGNAIYNWSYVDQVYDGLLAAGVRPFVELGFMPKKLASDPNDVQFFWYRPNVTAPKNYEKWDALVTAFTRHLLARYGIDEVAQWYFEVWNEPNIDFWHASPKQPTYFELYDHTARALKAVSPRLRVGGPATAQAGWVDAMIAHAAQTHVPLDFVSSHVYGDDVSHDVFGDNRTVPGHQMVAYGIAKVHDQILHSAMPRVPLIWSEFNASYANHQPITDSIYMGPWMADLLRQTDGEVQMMSYWSFSDVFDEQGPPQTPFYGGFGLIGEGGIPKPSFLVFSLLHTLGDTRLPVKADDVLATRRADGTLVLAAWNLAEPPGSAVSAKTVTITLPGLPPSAVATVERVDGTHGDTLSAWEAMGSPAYPSADQIAALKKIGTLAAPEPLAITGGTMTLQVPSSGLAVVEVRP